MASGMVLKEQESPPRPKVFGSARSRLLLLRTGAPPPPSSEGPEVAKLQSEAGMATLSRPVPRGVPGPGSPQVLAVDFSDSRGFHFGGQKGAGEALTVLEETRLDGSGVPGGYFVRCGRAAPGCVSLTLQLWNSDRPAPRGLRGSPPPPHSPGPGAAG